MQKVNGTLNYWIKLGLFVCQMTFVSIVLLFWSVIFFIVACSADSSQNSTCANLSRENTLCVLWCFSDIVLPTSESLRIVKQHLCLILQYYWSEDSFKKQQYYRLTACKGVCNTMKHERGREHMFEVSAESLMKPWRGLSSGWVSRLR